MIDWATLDPIRRAKMSASSTKRSLECTGWLALYRHILAEGLFYEQPTQDALSGQRIHAYLSGAPPDQELTLEEIRTGDMCASMRDRIVNELLSTGQTIVERRFWFRRGWEALFSGQPDFIRLTDDRALVANYKTGRHEEDTSWANLQLRTEIVLLAHNRPQLERIHGIIIQPWVGGDPEVVEYGPKEISEATAQVVQIADSLEWGSDTRTAGPWCFYCPVRAWCQEARDYVGRTHALGKDVVRGEIQIEPGERALKVYESISVARQLLDTLEDHFKHEMASNPEFLPGYYLAPGNMRRKVIGKYNEVASVMAQADLSEEELRECLSFSVPELREAWTIKSGVRKKDAETLFDQFMGELIEVKQDAKRIRPVPKRIRQKALQVQNKETQ
jgi:Protein of unknown function (DUF2800)